MSDACDFMRLLWLLARRPVHVGSKTPRRVGTRKDATMSWRALLVLVLVSIYGCAPDATWHGDVAFTLDERAAIEQGASFTAAHVGVSTPVIVWDGPTRDVDEGRAIVRGVPPLLLCPDDVGCASAHRIWLAPGYATAAFAAHEFGHTFGLAHHDEPGLMHPSVSALEWTSADDADCAAHCNH